MCSTASSAIATVTQSAAGIGKCDGAADRAARAHRSVGDVAGGVTHQAVRAVRHETVLEGGMGRERAITHGVAGFFNCPQCRDATDVEQRVGRR